MEGPTHEFTGTLEPRVSASAFEFTSFATNAEPFQEEGLECCEGFQHMVVSGTDSVQGGRHGEAITAE